MSSNLTEEEKGAVSGRIRVRVVQAEGRTSAKVLRLEQTWCGWRTLRCPVGLKDAE